MTLWSQDKYIKALRCAAEAHSGQAFPGTNLPYLMHINLVGMEVMAAISMDQNKRDGDLAVQCALLHDVIEDADPRYCSTKVTKCVTLHEQFI